MQTIVKKIPLYSNEMVFKLLEEHFLGIKLKDADRALTPFHQDVKYLNFEMGESEGLHRVRSEVAKDIENTASFDFEIDTIAFDEKLSIATAIVEYEALLNKSNYWQRLRTIAVLEIKDNLISSITITEPRVIKHL